MKWWKYQLMNCQSNPLLETLLGATVQGQDVVLRQESPALVVQGAGVGIIAVGTDLDVGVGFVTDHLAHVAETVLDCLGEVGDSISQIPGRHEHQRFLSVCSTMQDRLGAFWCAFVRTCEF